MPKIAIDARMINSSGIGTTIRGLLDATSPEDFKRTVLLASPDFKHSYPCETMMVSYPVYSLGQHWGYGKFLNRQNFGLYHFPHYDVPLSYRGPLIITVHDIIHILFPQYSTKPLSLLYAKVVLKNALKRADRIIAVSNHTKKDVQSFHPECGDKIEVIHPAVGTDFQPASENEKKRVLSAHSLKEGYVLYVGNLRDSKNTRGLIESYSSLRAADSSIPSLVLAGHNTYRDYEKKGFPPGVQYLGPVPFSDLKGLYSAASVFVFPSFYEGFGLPPLEAMACGTPVMASNRASLPEVCGEAALYVDPSSKTDMARSLKDLLGSIDKRQALRIKGLNQVKKYSWNDFARKTWALYDKVLKERRAI